MTPRIKQPSESRVYELDFGGDLGADVGEVTAIEIEPRGRVAQTAALEAASSAIAGSLVRVELAGGTAGELYLVTVKVAADGVPGDAEQEFELLVEDLAWTVPDGSSAYLSIEAFVTRLGVEDSIRLTDEAGTGRIDKARLLTALVDAQAEVDSYLAKRYAVPLTGTIPPRIAQLVYDIAAAGLYRNGPPENLKDARAEARKGLRDLAAGTATLPAGELPAPAPASATPVVFESATRRFTRRSMRDF